MRYCTDRTCGGWDCESCNPGGARWLTCRNCDAHVQAWEVGEENHADSDSETFICDECLPFWNPETCEFGDITFEEVLAQWDAEEAEKVKKETNNEQQITGKRPTSSNKVGHRVYC